MHPSATFPCLGLEEENSSYKETLLQLLSVMMPRSTGKSLLILLLVILWSVKGYSADYYWVGGTGDWSDINHWATTSGGSLTHFTVPSPYDDVYFDQNSFSSSGDTVYMNLNIITCRNFDCSQAANSPTFLSNSNTTVEIYGSITLREDIGFFVNSNISLLSNGPGNEIKLAGHTILRDLTFNGNGGEWALLDSLIVAGGGIIHFKEGGLVTNGNTIRCSQFNSAYASPRTLDLGSSEIHAYSYWTVDKAGLSLDPGTSRIVLHANNGKFISSGAGSVTYHDLEFLGTTQTSTLNAISVTFNRVTINNSANIFGNNTYGDLVLTKGKTYSFASQTTHTFLDSLVAKGFCLEPIQLKSFSGTTDFAKSSGNITVEYCEISDIHATGGASFYAVACDDLGNTNGWQFTPPASRTLYWVDGTGNWSDTSNWSASSGGPSGACPPTYLDDVVFDLNSFPNDSDSVVLNTSHSYCHDMTWMANGKNPTFLGANDRFLHVYGSLQFQPVMEFEFYGPVYFEATTLGNTVTMAGQKLRQFAEFRGDSGEWILQDDFYIADQNLKLVRGHLNTNGQTVTCHHFMSELSNVRELSLGSSKIYVTGDGPVSAKFRGQDLTLNAGTSVFIIEPPGAKFSVENGGLLEFNNILFAAESGTALLSQDVCTYNQVRYMSNGRIEGMTTIDSLWLETGKKYVIEDSTTHALGHLIADGRCNDPIVLETTAIGATAVFDGGPDTSRVYDLVLQDIQCTNGSHFYAYNTVDLGNTDGWNIQERLGQDYYWVGGSGNWADTLHWSLTSGGLPGSCIPSPVDNVIFDANSFLTSADTVLADLDRIMCHDMSWLISQDTPVFMADDSLTWRIYGSLLLSSSMDYQFEGGVHFLADTNDKTITSAGNAFLNNMTFNHVDGGWTIMDSLTMACVPCKLDLVTGAIFAAGKVLTIADFRSDKPNPKQLDIHGSEVIIYQGNWLLNADTTIIDADSSTIRFTGNVGAFRHSRDDTTAYWNVFFEHEDANYQLYVDPGSCTFNVVEFAGSATIFGNSIYDSVLFSPGKNYTLEAGSTQRLNTLIADGNCFEKISISSFNPSVQSTIHKDGDTLRGNYLRLNGISGQGSAVFLAENSEDLGNNTNWIIEEVQGKNLYWVNGSGDWFDPDHWSYTSGGPSGACLPTHNDDVFFDANSFVDNADTVFLDGEAECHDMTWIIPSGQPMLDGNWPMNVYGSLTFDDSLVNKLNEIWYFKSDSMFEEIYSSNVAFISDVVFNGSGAWNLMDSLVSNKSVKLQKGILNTQGNNVTCASFNSDFDETRSLFLSSSIITITSAAQFGWVMDGTNMTLHPGTSLIRFLLPSGMDNQTGNDLDYYDVEFMNPSGNTLLRTAQTSCTFNHVIIRNGARIFGQNTYDSLTFFPDNTYRLDINNPQVITEYFWIRGNNCFPVRLESTVEGTQAEVVKTAGDVQGDFIHMRDIKATGGAAFYAGANSADIDNNTGWIFNNAPSYVYGLPDDTFLIKGMPFVISTVNFNGGPSTTYLWDDGSTGTTLTVTSPGVYYVTVSYDDNCVVMDSITISCRLELDFDPTPTTCNAYSDGSIELEVGGDPYPYTYLWSTGDTIEDVTGLSAGWYTVTVSDSICYGIDSVEVIEPPLPDAELSDTAFCEDTTVTIQAKPGFMDYLWYDGSTGPMITLNDADSIWLIVTDSNGCVSVKFEAYVKEDPLPFPQLGLDSCVAFDGSLWLDPGNFDAYSWQDGSSSREFLVQKEGTYWVTVKQATCYTTDSVFIDACPPSFEIPNVFTPNGDGYNEYFLPEAVNIVKYRILIFNRWGEVVYENDDIYQGWDGRRNGVSCAEGTYFYTIEYEAYLQEGHRQSTRGSVLLLR